MTGPDDKKQPLDFQSSLVKKLQSDLHDALAVQDEVMRGSRIYWQRVHAVHQAVVALVESVSLQDLLNRLQDDIGPVLGVDVIQLFLSNEGTGGNTSMLMRPIPPVFLTLRDKEAFAAENPGQLELLFPDQAALIGAALCLPLAGTGFRGLLALGSRDEARFAAGLAHEPYIFLARVIERLVASCQNRQA